MDADEFDYDLIILGAGIQGVGVAQAAAAEGWSTIVLEKQPGVAMGTSSKSSKLIHGGLRYLETLQIKLVRECLKEKQLLCSIAPTLVKPARFVIPVYASNQRAPFWVQLGLFLYKLLSWPRLGGVRGRYSKSDWSEHPQFKNGGLQAIFEYEDAQTDDAALTAAVMRSAQSLGASLRTNIDIKSIAPREQGFELLLADGERLRSRALVNATGPWVNQTASLVQSKLTPTMAVDLVQGTHIVLNRPAMDCCYYLESPDDGRAMFVLPWKGKTMVGTTEKLYEGDPINCCASEGEVSYLLRAFNYYFPELQAADKDIVERFAGLRVLPTDATSANKRSRDTLYLQSPALPGYLAIYGGKLTAYRMSAEKLISKLKAVLPSSTKVADTRNLPLS